MATSINTAALTGSSLDVKSIVNQLMQVERQPIEALKSRLDTTGVRITALGSFQSKLSTLQDAVEVLQTPALFKRLSASSSNTGVLTAAAGTDAIPGAYDINVINLASASRFAVLDMGTANPPRRYELGLSIDGQARSFSFTASSLTDLQTQINANSELNGRLSLGLLDAQRGFLQGLNTGAANAVTLRINGLAQVADVPAADARLVMAGLDVQNAENRFEALGLDINLTAAGASQVNVRRERVDASAAVDTLVAAYNQVQAEYKLLTVSSVSARERGALNSDSTLAGIMQQLNAQLRGSFSDGQGANRGLSDLGLEFSRSGQLVRMNTGGPTATALSDRLASGLTMGTSATVNVANFMEQTLSLGGSLSERVEAEKTIQRDLQSKQSVLEEKMLDIERRYTSKYAALDALLFRLNTTSTALKSSLDALSASMKDN